MGPKIDIETHLCFKKLETIFMENFPNNKHTIMHTTKTKDQI